MKARFDKEYLTYCLIRTAVYPIGWLPMPCIRLLGNFLGFIGYYSMTAYRKRALSNLALASKLQLSHAQIRRMARQSFQNLATTCLEYPKLSSAKNLKKFIRCERKEQIDKAIFFCAHQNNWEILFLDATSRNKGIAIGKPIKNKYLYQWILSIREKHGGKMIEPRNAVKEGLRHLRKGYFFGIVGDQGMPGSGYSYPFLGRRAWTSPAPALLAYKTNTPIIFSSVRRTFNGFATYYYDPIWPNLNAPIDREVPRLMDETLKILEEDIGKRPGDWLWQHNRWKQQTMHALYRRFRLDAICILLPSVGFQAVSSHIATLKKIYDGAFLFIFCPATEKCPIEADEIHYYNKLEETFVQDYRFKIVFNFSGEKALKNHFLRYSASEVLDIADLKQLAFEHLLPHHDLSAIMERALCRPNSIWSHHAV